MNASRVELIRAHDSGAPWPNNGRRLSGERREEVVGLLEEARDLLGWATEPAPTRIVDHDSARRALDALWEHAVGELEGAARVADPERAPRFVGLLHWIKAASERLTQDQLRGRDLMFQRVREVLALLREAESTGKLVDQAPLAVCNLGFDRAIVSRIEDSFWIPENVHVERDARWAEEILAAGRAELQQLTTGLLETEIVRRKSPILVDNVQERQGVHRPIAEASLARFYAAAPIMADGAVIGFVHADCYHQQRNLDEVDRNLLAMFGEGLGQALARTSVLDQLGTLRNEADQLASSVTAAQCQRPWSGVARPDAERAETDPQRGPGGWRYALPDRPRGQVPDHPVLTRREMDVLAHMADGDTNARIARRLVVSEGTVKSHVKHILRKLGAANRAEAVSYWMRFEHGPAEREPRAAGAARS